MAAARVPERLSRAVQVVDPRPDDRILEIGAGPGVAAALVCERLTGDGRFVGIDRSATAVGRATARNAGFVARGLADFRQVALGEVVPGQERFDKIFAVNVNVFWTTPEGPESGIVRELLAPGGVFHLIYEGPPGTARSAQVVETVTGALRRGGLAAHTGNSSPSILCVTATPAGP
ncbi:SAM-dependent methyltransferase [Spirillospora sp. CA-294931]|uniref:SAM-dependent methyltransferase n=1 Tax=Spirillospora sp. CA-294931 TaxID=3240042 RepID=UPI003D8A7DF3